MREGGGTTKSVKENIEKKLTCKADDFANIVFCKKLVTHIDLLHLIQEDILLHLYIGEYISLQPTREKYLTPLTATPPSLPLRSTCYTRLIILTQI